jgi:hypothetical protein
MLCIGFEFPAGNSGPSGSNAASLLRKLECDGPKAGHRAP